MLEAFHNGKFEYKKISQEEQKKRRILGRLTGIIADTSKPTRNGRIYSKKLWQNVFNDPLMKEKIANRCVFMELGHPTDRTEIDMEKICACLAEQPKIGDDGFIYGTIDILDTKNGQLLKTLCDYGTTVGISSRGEGDLITGFDGQEEVDPDTYTCETWDIVLVPSVESARLKYVTESLDKTRYNKTLRQSLQESLDKASESDRKIMKEALDELKIDLTEGNDQMTDDEILDEISGTLGLDDNEKEAFINDVKSGNGQKYADDVEAHCCDKCRARFKKMIGEELTESENNVFQKFKYFKDKINSTQDVSIKHLILDCAKQSDLTDDMIDELHNLVDNTKDESLNEDTSKEWKPNTSFKHIKQIYNKVKSNNYKYVNNEREEMKAAVDKADKGGYTPEERRQIRDWYEEIWKSHKDIQDESLNINEEQNIAVDNNEAIVEELQQLIKANTDLETEVMNLQEKLSVCYAKESKHQEEAVKYKNTVKSLAESAKTAKALQVKVSTLEQKINEANKVNTDLHIRLKEAVENINKNNSKSTELKESLTTKSDEVRQLRDRVTKLTESVSNEKSNAASLQEALNTSQEQNKKILSQNKKLKEAQETLKSENTKLNESVAQLQKDKDLQKTNYSNKLEKSKQIIEKYKKTTATAIDRYIDLQARMVGSTVNELKNRLPESYSFKDIDKASEELQSYKLTMSKLPYAISNKQLKEDVRIVATPSKNESILPATHGFDDDVDEDLLYLAGK